MLFTNLAAVAALSVLADGFLLPPPISPADVDTVNALPFEISAEGVSTTVELKCTGCPVPAVNLDGSSIQHVESTLQLAYVIEHNANAADRLLLNGIPVYPSKIASLEPFHATQIFSADQPFNPLEDVPLGYEMTTELVSRDSGDSELIAIHLHIIEVADKFVNGIDSVELRLLKTPSGQLMIASAETRPSTGTSPFGSIIDDKDCTSMMCKWRAILAAKLAHLKPLVKGCHKGKGKGKGEMAAGSIGEVKSENKNENNDENKNENKNENKDENRPHHSGGHHKGGHRHQLNRGFFKVMHMLRKVAIHVLIPIFVGIAAGLTASVIGMAMGQLIIFAWRSIRGERAAYSRVEKGEAYDEERKVLIVEPQGPPPVYEDAVVVVVENAAEEKKEEN